MEEIRIHYDAVEQKTSALQSHINTQLFPAMERDYEAIRHLLSLTDGLASRELKEAMEYQRQRSVLAAETLEKLLLFVKNSSQKFQAKETAIAVSIAEGRV